MNVQLAPDVKDKLKKQNVRIRKSFKIRITIFSKNPHDPQLRNHSLKDQWKGHRSINITADLRAIYKELREDEEIIAYFVAIGTHRELYK